MQNRPFDKRIAVGIGLLVSTGLSAVAADVAYEEKPATEPIVVTDGTSTFRGSSLVDDLVAYWSFDDPNDLGKDSSGNGNNLEWCKGGSNSITCDQAASKVGVATNEAKRVTSMCFNENYSGVLRNVPEALDGTKPFTVACWFYVQPDAVETGNSIAYGLFGLGNATNSGASATMTLRIGASDSNKQTTLKTITFGPAGSGNGNISTDNLAEPKPASFKEAGWTFIYMTYTPNQETRKASYKVRCNGTSEFRYATNAPWIDSTTEPENYVFFVGSCRYAQYFRSIRNKNVLLDEAMVFSKALDDDEANWVMEHTRPADFAASWQLDSTGLLNLAGSQLLQDVFGTGGSVTSPTAMKIGSTESRSFGGGFAGAGDAELAPAAGQTFVLMGASTHEGKTAVKSGTVALLSSGAAELKTAFGDNLRAFWSFDGFGDDAWKYDWSGNGHALTEQRQKWSTGCSYVAETTGAAAHVGWGLEHLNGNDLGMEVSTDNKTDNNLRPISTLSGFTEKADNAFTVSLWAKTASDATSRSGFLRLDGATSGMRFSETPSSHNGLIMGHKLDKYLGAAVPMKEGESHVGGGAWHHYVLTYDNADPAARQYSVYIDNEHKLTQAGTNTPGTVKNFGNSSYLLLGIGLENATKRSWHGWLDEVVILNRAVTADEVSTLYNHRTATPTAATAILPATTDLDIAAGATVAGDLVNETVSGLSGSGILSLSATARLSVTDALSFTGTVTGAGRLALGNALVLKTGGTVEAPHVYEFLTAPLGVVVRPDVLTDWTLENVGRFAVTFAFRDNGDGTETLVAQVSKTGVILIVR